MKHVYIAELSDIQDTGLKGNIHKMDYFKSVNDSKIYIDSLLLINNGFNFTEIPLTDIDKLEGYIYNINYTWNNNHQQNNYNKHLPEKNIITNIKVKKVRLKYT